MCCVGFIFLPQASGVAEEYIFHTLEEDYINKDVMTALEKLNATSLPRWDNCSADNNMLRDNLTKYFSDEQERTGIEMDYYRLWNIGKGCEHGSALDQMTMTYTSFTGYLRLVQGRVFSQFRFI